LHLSLHYNVIENGDQFTLLKLESFLGDSLVAVNVGPE
jgi:hypothetical protein